MAKVCEIVGAIAIAWGIVAAAFALTEPRIPQTPVACHCQQGGECCCCWERHCGCMFDELEDD